MTLKCAVLMPARLPSSRWILQSIASIWSQESADDWEHELRIGVDDCDRTSAALLNEGIPHWFSADRLGPWVMRNSLRALGEADAYATFDADDEMRQGYLKVLCPLAYPRSIAGGSRVHLDEQGHRISEGLAHTAGVAVYSACAMELLGGWRAWQVRGDRDLQHRADSLGIETVRTSDAQFYRRVHAGAITQDPKLDKVRRDAHEDMVRLARAGELRVRPMVRALERRGE